jgi:UDP-2-acetamido-3-amino-2,3-dideoxy-glucuronate N-acetyltransferase
MPISPTVKLAEDAVVVYPDLVNLYGCTIGSRTSIGPFVEVQSGVSIGERCKISSHSFLCSGVTIEDEVFVGHGVMFVNDLYPRATTDGGDLQTGADWEVIPTRICHRASLGSNVTILGGVTVGDGALVGAGAVVTRDVPPYAVVVGNPARVVGDVRDRSAGTGTDT